MPRAQVNEITIEYDTFGRNDADPLLLVMGLGMPNDLQHLAKPSQPAIGSDAL